jgi:hypothetical protein
VLQGTDGQARTSPTSIGVMQSPAITVTVGHTVTHLGQIVVAGRPVSLNAERSAHWRKRHALTASWREQAAILARRDLKPIVDRPIIVEAFPIQKGRLPDAGNAYPTVKAIVDGIVDAGIIPDDDPDSVASIVLQAPRRPTPGEGEHVTINLWATTD